MNQLSGWLGMKLEVIFLSMSYTCELVAKPMLDSKKALTDLLLKRRRLYLICKT